MLRASRPAATIASASMTVAAARQRPATTGTASPAVVRAAGAAAYDGSSISSAATAEMMTITCWVRSVPIHGISTKLVIIDPAIAPTVLAAYTPPARRAAS